ncbi:olfactory receptor 1D5-like [Gastrophryne carolinensis]
MHQIWFNIFTMAYTVTLAGNLTIIGVIRADPHLHKPMYFLLENLSFLDVSMTTVIVPNMLHILSRSHKAISFTGCISQMYFYEVVMVAECFILVVMAYDRYAAICLPFRYPILMTKLTLVLMVGFCWLMGTIYSLTETILLLRSVFCSPNVIHGFFCDGSLIMKLSCSDTTTLHLFQLFAGLFVGPLPVFMVLGSYVAIISTVVKIHNTEGRNKAFSTCVSHLVVVTLFYGTGIFTYIIQPIIVDPHSPVNNIFSVVYTILAPMLNPFIYSLRNQEIHKGCRHVLKRLGLQTS